MIGRRNPWSLRTATLLVFLAAAAMIFSGTTRAADAPKKKVPAVDKTMILVHGLWQDGKDLQKLSNLLGNNGFKVLRFEYASNEVMVEDASAELARFVRKHAPTTEVHFVGFSLGNLVIRQCLGRIQKLKPRPKVGRIVMIAPPNHGARTATKYNKKRIGRLIGGPVIRQLGPEFNKLQPTLDTPRDFGIIAGGKGDNIGYSKKDLPGDDDDWLTVETTRLSGAADFRLVKARHAKLDDDSRVHKLALEFLENGYFESAQTRQRIP